MVGSGIASATGRRPQLVVGIMVEGLRADYLDVLSDCFGPDGFKRLMRDGWYIENADYGTTLDPTAATAMIFTGAPPAVNGIPASTVYDPERHTALATLHDPSKIGNFTDDTYSPSALAVSTIADELRIDNGGLGYVYSLAPDASQAIIMAGHAGNSAFWISDSSGKWATTTFYKDVPTTISTRNFATPLSTRLDTMVWTPARPTDTYPDLPDYKKYYPFRHTFNGREADRVKRFKASAPANHEVASVAIDYINNLRLGTRDAMDMLNLAFSLDPSEVTSEAECRFETMDSYLRLDGELATLLATIDSKVGLHNTVIMLAGTPARQSRQPDDPKWALPHGEFSPRRAISLLNMYLIAKHGNGDWVSGYHNGQFFLNSKLIKDRGLDITGLRTDAAGFLARMSGVSQAWTIDDITASRIGSRPEMTRRNTTLRHAGDVFIAVNPGWEIVDDTIDPPVRTTQRVAATTSPVIIFAPQAGAGRINTPVDALDIAPTVARILRIRSPNGAANSPISTIFAPLNHRK